MNSNPPKQTFFQNQWRSRNRNQSIRLYTIVQKSMFLGILLLSFFTSCKDKEYRGLSGVWLVEEVGEVTPFRRYNISIRKHEAIDSVYVVNNFCRSGDHTETYFEVNGLNITIYGQQIDNLYLYEGSGTIQSDFKLINLTYRISNSRTGVIENFTAQYRRN